MANLKLFFVAFALALLSVEAQYQIGLGRADCTGPAVEIAFMGYGALDQRGQGIHTRQFARTFIVQDGGGRRIVFVSIDISAVSHAIRRQVIAGLQQRGLGSFYRIDNVMLSAQHTHGGPGGYHQFVMYDSTTLGFSRETFDAIVNGIVQSIVNAHNSMFAGRIFLTEIPLATVGVNRSPKSYLLNPASERAQFSSDMDQNLVQLRFQTNAGEIRGAFHWMATHAVSMNNTNRLVSSDNLGAAAMFLEQQYNPGQQIGRGTFIGAFSTSNSGDISPNTNGPRCIERGGYCDPIESSCPDRDVCIAFGPGATDMESTRIIAQNLFNGAWTLLRNGGGRELTGNVGSIHQFIEPSAVTGTWFNPALNRQEAYRGCLAAMGHSFAAGTTDGPGAFNFTQGTTEDNPFWNAVRNFLAEPTPDDFACHAPKPILLMTGRTTRPYLWQPNILPVQAFMLGDAIIAGMPGEYTTMAGRRIRTEIQNVGRQLNRPNLFPILSTMTNIYSSYVVTYEEYQLQRYEAASTPYGPHTHTIIQQTYTRLLTAMLQGTTVPPGPTPLDQTNEQVTFIVPVINDDAGNSFFGAVITQPLARYNRGQTVFCTFVSANPRNNVRAESSFFYVELLQANGLWSVVATDANWETRFVWRRTNTLRGNSESDFFWTIPATAVAGEYRIRHEGTSRGPVSGLREYFGTTQLFSI